MKAFQNFISSQLHVSNVSNELSEGVRILEPFLTKRHVSKNSLIDTERNCYFVKDSLFYQTYGKQNNIVSFYCTGELIYHDYQTNIHPSFLPSYCIRAYCDSHVWCIPKTELHKLSLAHASIAQIIHILLERQRHQSELLQYILRQPVHERIIYLQSQRHLIENVSNKHLAAYINTTPETYSRVSKEMLKNNYSHEKPIKT